MPVQLADRLCSVDDPEQFWKSKPSDISVADKVVSKKIIISDNLKNVTPGMNSFDKEDALGVRKVTPDGPSTDTQPMSVQKFSDESNVISPSLETAPMKDLSSTDVTSDKSTLENLPVVPNNRLNREFTIVGLDGVEITSLDITAHGCYLLAGCGNGMVLLFDLTQSLKEPALVGQILAKGLHTNLLMTVKITEDCRFCFAGVSKGSSELLAIDLGKLPAWSDNFQIAKRRSGFVNNLVTCHSRSDPKLRGFGSAVRVKGTKETYRLASGLGIKNVHVWQFTPPNERNPEPQWVCMYDVASNGNTIQTVGFRSGGHELLSKSAGVNLRVWDLTNFEKDPTARPNFEDVANSHDVCSLLDGFALGGIYEFAIVKLAAPKSANRDALGVPERQNDGDDGNRRRRMMRQIDSVIGTSDARHALALCADGGVLYYNRPEDSDKTRGTLMELPSLERDPDTLIQSGGRDWSLKRIGAQGEVVLLRATQTSPVKIIATPITNESTAMKPSSIQGDSQPWNAWGYYKDLDTDYDFEPFVEPEIEKEEKGVTVTESKKKLQSSKNSKSGQGKAGRPPLVPQNPSGTGTKRPRSKATIERVSTPVQSSTTSVSVGSKDGYVPPARGRPKSTSSTSGDLPPKEHVTKKYTKYAEQKVVEDDYLNREDFTFEEDVPVKRQSLELAPAPRVRRVVVTPFSSSSYISQDQNVSRENKSVASIVMARFRSLCTHWINSTRKIPQIYQNSIIAYRNNDNSTKSALGVCALRKIGELCLEQDRIRSQFVAEVTRTIAKHLMTLNSHHVDDSVKINMEIDAATLTGSVLPLSQACYDIESDIMKYQALVGEVLIRQQMDVSSAIAMDSLSSLKYNANLTHVVGTKEPKHKVIFCYEDLWSSARSFLETVQLLVQHASL